MRARISMACLLATLFLVMSGIALPQGTNQNQTLIINGQSTEVSVIQVNGRSYVDLQALADAVNGSVSSAGNRIALSVPVGNARVSPATTSATASPPPAPATASNPGFSKAFLNAGIEQMAAVREWHAALSALIQNGNVTSDMLAPYRAQATTKLSLASVAASTSSDRLAYQLLSNEFQNMVNLSNKYVDMRANLTYISPDALDRDSVNQGVVMCGNMLRAMAANGLFLDDGSCD